MGVDIGCGMCAVPIEGLYKDDLSDEALHRLQSLIKARIPTSFDSHDAQLPWARQTLKDISRSLAELCSFLPHGSCSTEGNIIRQTTWPSGLKRSPRLAVSWGPWVGAIISWKWSTRKEMSRLAWQHSAMHFLPLKIRRISHQVWCMLHSGSRNVGNTTASFYDRVAGERPLGGFSLCKTHWFAPCRPIVHEASTSHANRTLSFAEHYHFLCTRLDRGVALRGLHGSLNYLDVESKDGHNYLKDMQWCASAALDHFKFLAPALAKTVRSSLCPREPTQHAGADDFNRGRSDWQES